jgi:hypothetical protein
MFLPSIQVACDLYSTTPDVSAGDRGRSHREALKFARRQPLRPPGRHPARRELSLAPTTAPMADRPG